MCNDEIGIVWWDPEHDEIELELCDYDKQILTHLDVIPSPGIFPPPNKHGSGRWPLGRLNSSMNRLYSTSMVVSGRVHYA